MGQRPTVSLFLLPEPCSLQLPPHGVSIVVVLRFRRPDMDRPFRVWAYPLPPVFFLVVTFWTMYWAFQGRPVESTLALLTVVTGAGIFSAAALLRH